jgi:hypothetical protein
MGAAMRIMSVLAATGAGAAVGWVCGLVPVWPVVRFAVATVIGLIVGAVGVVVFMLFPLNLSGSGGLGSVSFGMSEAVLLRVPAVVMVAVISYFALRRLGWNPASLATYGPIIFGGGAALIAALWVARGLAISGGS